MVKKFFIGIAKLAVYLIFVVALIYFIPKILAKALHTPYPLATITSGSMWPVLKIDDLILMKGIRGQDAQVGQIIVYQNAAQGFTIHRLIRKENGMLVTKGDANDAEDPPISEKDVIGRAAYIGSSPVRIPYLGFIARQFGQRVR